MRKRLTVLAAAIVLAWALGWAPGPPGGVARVSADPFGSTANLGMVACGAGDVGPCDDDANQDVGAVVTTYLDAGLAANHGSFYDASEIQITGVELQSNVPIADRVGLGSFSIHVDGAGCSDAAPLVTGTFDLYNAAAHGISQATPYPSLGYAGGLAAGEDWSMFAPNWIADFDDDNTNNIPDRNEGVFPAFDGDTDTLPETVTDKHGPDGYTGAPDGIPDSVQGNLAPLYLPLEDAVVGAAATSRFFGHAIIAEGVLHVPVDFVTYAGLPSASTYTQMVVIGQGTAAGFMSMDPLIAGVVTCPPFTASIRIDGTSESGAAVQRVVTSGSYAFRGSTADDFDGDGIPTYQDNCDTIPNAAQADRDADGIGDACDHDTGTGANVDGDGVANDVDPCPELATAGDHDHDGVQTYCDPAWYIRGDGQGYASPPPGSYDDHDFIDSDTFTAGADEGLAPGDATHVEFLDANDNHIPDSVDCASDSDGDGQPDCTDLDPLDPTTPTPDRAAICAALAQPDCDYDPAFPTFYGDGCPDAEEPGKSIGGVPLSGSSPWDFYSVPVPALFAAPDPTTTFRANTISAGGAQAVFGYFKRGAKSGNVYYEQDLNANGVADGIEYDRKISGGGPTLGPDGVIGAAEAQKAFAEFKSGLKCTTGPGYKLDD